MIPRRAARKGRRRLAGTLLAGFLSVGLSPAAMPAQAAFPGQDGRIAFTRDIGTNAEVFTMDADGSSQVRVTDTAADERRPSFSPGGTRIAVASLRSGNWEIFTSNFDGTSPFNSTNDTAAEDYTPAFSPDGTKIAYASFRGPNADIYLTDPDGSGERRLTTTDPADEFYPAVSPDGEKITFMSDRDGDWEIFIIDADGTNERKLTDNGAGDLHPVFSPDGKRIAFESNRNGNVEILTMKLDGTAARNRSKNPATDLRPAFSPDGEEIAFDTNRDGNREIYTMNADGSNQVNRSRNPGSDDAVPDWGVKIGPPRVSARRFPRRCASQGFRVRVKIASADSRHKAKVSLDGRRIAKTRKASFKLRVPAKRLRRGRHRVTVLVRDVAGNRTRRSFRFRRCAKKQPSTKRRPG
ncbi:MAG: hypothetical protein M3383_09440 [Actinomycetota bacterium]|nr:hypothetical protein [Actinomycetota bacterium]